MRESQVMASLENIPISLEKPRWNTNRNPIIKDVMNLSKKNNRKE